LHQPFLIGRDCCLHETCGPEVNLSREFGAYRWPVTAVMLIVETFIKFRGERGTQIIYFDAGTNRTLTLVYMPEQINSAEDTPSLEQLDD
jgi:hypothetical protein